MMPGCGWGAWGAWAGMGLGWLVLPLLWLGLIALIVWAVFQLTRDRGEQRQSPAQVDTPWDVLDRRLANGEIDVEAYQQARAALGQRGQVPQ